MMEVETLAHNEKRSVFSAEIEELLERERKARQNNLHHHSVTILQEIIQLAFDAKKWTDLNELVVLLAKKRGQPVKAQVDMVKLAMSFIDKIEDEDVKMNFIRAMKTVCEKKIYLEVEYARCCLMIVRKSETDQNIEEASKILLDVQVETYGSMDTREKLEFIMYQMKIMILKKDMINLLIVSRKLGKKSFVEPNLEDLQILYNCYLYILYHSEKEYLQSATALLTILDLMIKDPIPQVLSPLPATINPPPPFEPRVPLHDLDQVFSMILFYTMQSPSSTQKSDILKQLHTDIKYSRFLNNNQSLSDLLSHYRNTNLINTDINHFGAHNCVIYQNQVEKDSEENRSLLRKNLIKHNISISSVYYKRATLLRLAQLFGAEQQEVEDNICEMVSDSQIVAKIDRLEGQVIFGRNKLTKTGELETIDPVKSTILRADEEVLDEWVDDVNALMELVDQTCSLIHREEENYASQLTNYTIFK